MRGNLAPKNVNNIEIGQSARVNQLSYGFSKYGSLGGFVRSIAKNTTPSVNGGVLLNIWVECRSTKFPKSDEIPWIIPMMLVQVELTEKNEVVQIIYYNQ